MKAKKALFRGLCAAILCACLTLPAVAQTFPDVPPAHWAYANIEEAASDGAVRGYQDGSFAPANPLSLAHFTVILARSFYGDELDAIPVSASAAWYDAAETVARNHGLLTGVDAAMNDPLSRYETAVEIRNLLTARGLTFSERAAQESAASIEDWDEFPSYGVRDAVACVYSLGILGGYADGKFHGENILNRAQAAAIYCRVKNVLADFASPLFDDSTPVDNSEPVDRTPVDNSEPDNRTPVDIPDNATPEEILEKQLENGIRELEKILNDLNDIITPSPDESQPELVPDESQPEAVPDETPDESQPEPVADEAQAFREEVLRLVNEARAQEGLSKLTLSDKLVEAAQIRAEELPEEFSHTRPDGASCFTVLSEVGVRYMATGENIAAGQPTPADVMDSWMNSSGHRANILSGNYSQLGVGVCKSSGGYGIYWVQLFTD